MSAQTVCVCHCYYLFALSPYLFFQKLALIIKRCHCFCCGCTGAVTARETAPKSVVATVCMYISNWCHFLLWLHRKWRHSHWHGAGVYKHCRHWRTGIYCHCHCHKKSIRSFHKAVRYSVAFACVFLLNSYPSGQVVPESVHWLSVSLPAVCIHST